MLLAYRPVRIIQKFSVVAKTLGKMKELYPNAIIESQHPSVSGYYKPGSVIDVPSKEEHGLFANIPDYLAAYIPQVDGFDDPTNGLARSRRASWRGKQKWMRSMDGAKVELPPKKVKIKPADIPIAEPELDAKIDKIKPKASASKKSKPKKSKSDDAKKSSQRKRTKKKEHLVSDTDSDELDLHINEKENEVIESDE